MSTVQDYQYRTTSADKRRLQAQQQQAQVRLARLKAQRAMALHQQALAEFNRQCQALANATARQKQALQDSQNHIDELAKQVTQLQLQLQNCKQRLVITEQQLNQAEQDLAIQLTTIKQLCDGMAEQDALLQQSIGIAEQTLQHSNELAAIGLDDAKQLTSVSAQTQQTATQFAELERQIQSLGRQMEFIRQNESLAPAAMTIILAMQENGYELKQSHSQEEMICYFEHQQHKYQMAIRVAPAIRQGEDIETWDMLAETFDTPGQQCLEELCDFDTAIEQIELGELVRVNRAPYPIYPKDDTSRGRQNRGVLPAPNSHLSRTSRNRRTSRLRAK